MVAPEVMIIRYNELAAAAIMVLDACQEDDKRGALICATES
jgi:hypothetical protein